MCTTFQREALRNRFFVLRPSGIDLHLGTRLCMPGLLCCEIVPVNVGAVERVRPGCRELPWGSVSKMGLGLAETTDIKRQRRPCVSQTSWADRIDPAAGFRGTVGPQSPTAAALVVVAVLCRE
jgi:hypothetical protein